MSLKKESETSWEMVTAHGERNQYDSVTATKDGLEIGYCGTIPWDEIDSARHAVAHANNHEHGDLAAFCSVRYCTERLRIGGAKASTFDFVHNGWRYAVRVEVTQAMEWKTPNALGEGRERGILREASSGEAATSTDGLEGNGT